MNSKIVDESRRVWGLVQKILSEGNCVLGIQQIRWRVEEHDGLVIEDWEKKALDAGWKPSFSHPLNVTDQVLLNVIHDAVSRGSLILTADWKFRLPN